MKNDKSDFIVKSVRAPTVIDKAMIEIGTELLKNSIKADSDFCKTMITVSTGAIPIYLGLVKLISPTIILLGIYTALIIPPIVFFISAIIFIVGYLPKIDTITLQILNDIEKKYEDTVSSRRKYVKWGLSVFMGGVILSTGFIIYYATIILK